MCTCSKYWRLDQLNNGAAVIYAVNPCILSENNFEVKLLLVWYISKLKQIQMVLNQLVGCPSPTEGP